jgi:hypothetical protein
MPTTDRVDAATLASPQAHQRPCQQWQAAVLGCLLLALCLLGSGGCRPTIIGPTQPSGYRLTLPETSQTLRLHPLTLTVRVTDASGMPAEDVPVHFRVLPEWATVAEISPPTVTTRQGQAAATFRARTAGQMMVEVMVEDLTRAIPIVVLGDGPRF